MWTATGGMNAIPLVSASTDYYFGTAIAINDAGTVVGNVSPTLGWIWDSTNGVRGLSGTAAGINDVGQVVGYMNVGNDRLHGFFRSASGTTTDLGTLPNGGYSYGYGINNLGVVVGKADIAGLGYRAFIWTAEGGMQNLGLLPGDDQSTADAVNNFGMVVGTSGLIAQNQEHVIWFNGVIYTIGLTDPDWTLGTLTAINDAGQIVGNGYHNGVQRAFLMTPVNAEPPATIPEPSPGFVVLSSAVVLIATRHVCRTRRQRAALTVRPPGL